MRKILVTYATMAGSTVDVARVVADEIAKSGLTVDVLPIAEVMSLAGYTGVVVGAPMIMGYHRAALRFLRKHRKAWQRIPLAVFVTAMSLTRTADLTPADSQVYVDTNLPKAPLNPDRLSFRERYARLSNYLGPIQRAANPVSIGVFGGRLEYGRLKPWAVMFVMLVIQAAAKDRRNWDAIKEWSAGLVPKLS